MVQGIREPRRVHTVQVGRLSTFAGQLVPKDQNALYSHLGPEL